MASPAAAGRSYPRPLSGARPAPSTPHAAAVDDALDTRISLESGASPPASRPHPPAGPSAPGGRVAAPRAERRRAPTLSSAPGDATPAPAGPPINPDNFPAGKIVAARVIKVGRTGLRVRLLEDDKVCGFVPDRELRTPSLPLNRGPGPVLALGVGDVREFVVTYLPRGASYGGAGPTLSARRLDDDLRWERAREVAATCRRDSETVAVVVEATNSGGLVTRFEGLPAFVPFSQVDLDGLLGKGNRPGAAEAAEKAAKDAAAAAEKAAIESSTSGAAAGGGGKDGDGTPRRPPGGAYYVSSAPARAAALGRTIQVVPTAVDKEAGRIVLSMRRAVEARAKSALAVGALVWGTVRKVEPFGLFVGLDNTKESALLHVSNVSRVRCERAEDVFNVGSRVRALIIGMDEGARRISLSTAELEAEDGDILEDAAAVFEGAPEQARVFLDHLATLAAGEEVEGGRSSGGVGGGGGGGGGGARRQQDTREADVPPLDW